MTRKLTRRLVLALALVAGLISNVEALLLFPGRSSDVELSTFGFTNWSGSSSEGYACFGLGFPVTAVPSGSIVVIQRSGSEIAAQFDERAYWPDGSLRFAVCSMRDSTFSGSEARTYKVVRRTGTFDNTGTKTLADITGATDFNFNVSTFTQYNGTTTVTRGSGAAFQSFNEAATQRALAFDAQSANFTIGQTLTGGTSGATAYIGGQADAGTTGVLYLRSVSGTFVDNETITDGGGGSATVNGVPTQTRLTKIHSGSVCEGWVLWAPMRDGSTGTGAEDAHLKVEWHVDLWKAANGSTYAIEHLPVLCQDWWSIASKFRLNYDSVYKDGASTIATFNTVQHPYRSRWAPVYTTNNNNYAKSHWTTGMPTLGYLPDRAYWIQSRLIPPLDTSITPDATPYNGPYNAAYVPCQSMNHRADIDDTGAYMGRGMLPNVDCVTFISQSFTDMRYSRTNALAGLSVIFHYRSNRTRTRPTESVADIANTVISFKLDPISSGDYTFTAQGMPIPVDAVVSGSAGVIDSYVDPTGGEGVWEGTVDNSHLVNYPYFMYLMEGKRYLLDACLNIAFSCVHRQTELATFRNLLYYTNAYRQALLSIPATVYRAIGGMNYQNNTRSAAWACNNIGTAAAVVPDSDVQCGATRLYARQQADYCFASIGYFPQSQKDAGFWLDLSAGGGNPWMSGLIAQGMLTFAAVLDNDDMLSVGTTMANVAIRAFSTPTGYRAGAQIVMSFPVLSDSGWVATTNEYFTGTNVYRGELFTYVHSTGYFSTVGTYGLITTPTNGDILYPSVYSLDIGANAVQVPYPFASGTPYYIVEASGSNFKLAATPGGAAIPLGFDGTLNFTGQSSNFTVGDTLTGGTSGATATMVRQLDNGTSGTLQLDVLSGTFQNAETITGALGGSATVSGTLTTTTSWWYGWNPAWGLGTVTPIAYNQDSFASIQYATLVLANKSGVAGATNAMCDAAETFINLSAPWTYLTWKMKRVA